MEIILELITQIKKISADGIDAIKLTLFNQYKFKISKKYLYYGKKSEVKSKVIYFKDYPELFFYLLSNNDFN